MLYPVDWDVENQRWRDIAGNPYARETKTTYTYQNASVALEYRASGPTFVGRLTAMGLKPCLAYQVKLNGKPEYFGEGDDWANEQLGRLGRWWAKKIRTADGALADQWRSNDKEFEAWKAKDFTDGEHVVVFEGYVLFDYFVTDADGRATKDLRLHGSYHVLWKKHQRQPGPGDSPAAMHPILARRLSGWYDEDCAAETLAIYAEGEPGRPAPHRCILPPGDYHVRLFLTEESFHEKAPHSGSWATVMTRDDVAFTIPAPTTA